MSEDTVPNSILQPDGPSGTKPLVIPVAALARQEWRPSAVRSAEWFLLNQAIRAGRMGTTAARWEAWHEQFTARLRPRPTRVRTTMEFARAEAAVRPLSAAVRLPGEARTSVTPTVPMPPVTAQASQFDRPVVSEAVQFSVPPLSAEQHVPGDALTTAPLPTVTKRVFPVVQWVAREAIEASSVSRVRPLSAAVRLPGEARTSVKPIAALPSMIVQSSPIGKSVTSETPSLSRPAVNLAFLGAPTLPPGEPDSEAVPGGLMRLSPRIVLHSASNPRREQPGGFPSGLVPPVRQGRPAESQNVSLELGASRPPGRLLPTTADVEDAAGSVYLPNTTVTARADGPNDSTGRPAPELRKTRDIVDWLLAPDGMPRRLPGMELRPIAPEEARTEPDRAPAPEEAPWRPASRPDYEIDLKRVANRVVEQVTTKMQRRERMERERKGLY